MWSLYEGEKELKPLRFSNGKTQEDVAKEVVDAIKSGEKIIFIKGVCGTGKSAIALNIAKELGKTAVVVPIKNLQKQYEQDYSYKKYVYKNEKEKLKIAMITGRVNHPCQYLKDHPIDLIRERNSRLIEIFEPSKEQIKKIKDKSADNPYIPCKIEIKEKNFEKIKPYLYENPNLKKNFSINDLDMITRMQVAPACPYWSPIIPSDSKTKLESKKKISYKAVDGMKEIYVRSHGCSYYEQFQNYVNADVIIFNSTQYLLETSLGRKPATDVEIIDECDEFLDNFAIEGKINLNLLSYEANMLNSPEPEQKELVIELKELLFDAYHEAEEKVIEDDEIQLKKTKFLELVKFFIANDMYKLTEDEENYVSQCSEICRNFDGIIDDTYVKFSQSDKNYNVQIVTINLHKTFNSLLEKNKAFVLMSGTLHSEKVLKDIFGIDNFKTIIAEEFNQGEINKVKTGYEGDFKYENFRNGKVSRVHYLKALQRCIEKAKRPTLVHVYSFSDLPNGEEKSKFDLKNLMTQEELKELQRYDHDGKLLKDFKNGETDILFTTKCNRGIDFPGEMCNSVVLTKYPYPDASSLFWKILRKNKPKIFWEFYKDKAQRELLQRIYRSVRSSDDKVDVLSPDIRVLDAEIV